MTLNAVISNTEANTTRARSLNSSISQGQTKTYKVKVDSGVKLLDVDLKWRDKSNKLSLTAYSPSKGTLETQYDKSDGSADGEIAYHIKAKDGGYLEKGDWKFKVYGKSVNGIENYTFKSYAHK
jgi:hypothetical protein